MSGRFYAMDRDNNWDRLKRAEEAMFECKGAVCTIKPSVYLDTLYTDGKKDELLEPIVCLGDTGKGCAIEKMTVCFFNFLPTALGCFPKMLEKQAKENVCFATLTEYS